MKKLLFALALLVSVSSFAQDEGEDQEIIDSTSIYDDYDEGYLTVDRINLDSLQDFEYVGEIKFEGDDLCPGTLSKDGKKYFVPHDNGDIEVYAIEKDGKFTKTGTINGPKPEGADFSGQISFTKDEKLLLYTGSIQNSWGGNNLFIATGEKFSKSTSLKEVNTEDVADCYGYISPDGLRIYFTKENKLYTASRKKTKGKFGKPEELGFESENDILSCWLTNDELEIYFSDNSYKIYTAKRESIKGKFGTPQLYTSDLSQSFTTAFNLSPDKKLAFAYNSEDTSRILILRVKKK